MSIIHHPDDSTLLSHAAGSLPAALAVVVAAHLTLCQRCRDEVADMELLGGALLGDLPGAALLGPVPDTPETHLHQPAAAAPAARTNEVPAPLARLMGDSLDAVRWRWVSPGSWLRRVPIGGAGQMHLLKCSPSVLLPEHGHAGSELTMVLRGTLTDHTGIYRAGDVCDLDDSIVHTPTAGTDGCICVVAQDRRVRFSSLVVRLARPWHGM
jgi:putative transcriptional regulator